MVDLCSARFTPQADWLASIYCERYGTGKRLTVRLSPTELECIQTVLADIVQNEAPVLAKANWSWEEEHSTARDAMQWKKLCGSVFMGPPPELGKIRPHFRHHSVRKRAKNPSP
jgi:hypothetical protein